MEGFLPASGPYTKLKKFIPNWENTVSSLLFFMAEVGQSVAVQDQLIYFLEALPHSSLNGHFRVTEQGEVIAQKYANLLNATYNLELLMAGVMGKTIEQQHTTPPTYGLEEVMEQLSLMSTKICILNSSNGLMTFLLSSDTH